MYFGYISASFHPFGVYKSSFWSWWVRDFEPAPAPVVTHTRNPWGLPQPLSFPTQSPWISRFKLVCLYWLYGTTTLWQQHWNQSFLPGQQGVQDWWILFCVHKMGSIYSNTEQHSLVSATCDLVCVNEKSTGYFTTMICMVLLCPEGPLSWTQVSMA